MASAKKGQIKGSLWVSNASKSGKTPCLTKRACNFLLRKTLFRKKNDFMDVFEFLLYINLSSMGSSIAFCSDIEECSFFQGFYQRILLYSVSRKSTMHRFSGIDFFITLFLPHLHLLRLLLRDFVFHVIEKTSRKFCVFRTASSLLFQVFNTLRNCCSQNDAPVVVSNSSCL